MKKKKKNDEEESGIKMGDFSSAIMQIAQEKGIPREAVIETVEAALAAAYKKDYGKKGQNIRAEFDEVTGQAKFFLVKEVVDETTREFVGSGENERGEDKLKKTKVKKEKTESSENKEKDKEKTGKEDKEEVETEKLPRFNPERDIILSEAKEINKEAKVGDIIETELETKSSFGRVAAQTAKQVIIQRIREAERDSMFKEYKEKEGEIINGTVQRIEGRNVFVDLGKSVGVLFPSEQMENESYRIGQRLKVYLVKVESDSKGPGIILSRAHPEIIRKLFALEVPEVFSGTVEIKEIAREAGSRTKIAVVSNEEGVDPIGSCVGQKGTRVQAVIDELGGEKIDIIEWSDDPEKFISAALSPAKVLSVDLNEENKTAVVKVPEDQLSLAIGKRGQNVRLAAKLTGWKIDVFGESASGDVQSSGQIEKIEESSSAVEQNEKEETKSDGEEGKSKEEERKNEK